MSLLNKIQSAYSNINTVLSQGGFQMKKYSTSKLLVIVFVIVLLLSLPYAFAGKPEKPPNPQEEPVWSVYVPETTADNSPNGLLGLGNSINNEDLGLMVYAYEDPATTRNFVNFINNSYSYFNFEIFIDNTQPLLQLNLAGIDSISFKCTEELVEGNCDGMLAEIQNLQPNGVYSKRIWFGFPSYAGFNYEKQEYNQPQRIQSGYFYIDNEVWAPTLDQTFIRGEFSGVTTVTRLSANVWHIECVPAELTLVQHPGVTDIIGEECNAGGKKCHNVYEFFPLAEGTVNMTPFDLYFVRVPAQ